ncbi:MULTISPECIES: protein-export chaperone SecB [Clostridium]|uniref:protein-export chaperone SecB n=1 Tax=Clostridium TaxID=1485 RepID=UPI001575D925|nr:MULTISPECIES: protein-export chaperone SecB [Clostridium]MDB2160497.1 protein-export chaperone SecB [Clostridium butyricum]MDU1231748.1 protein-export chaperone SecB [Clostridium sp.]MDU3091074.1 protein-export chaperone SecB [Clostridium sp.]MDU5104401.1 protein-export chaperone SecB [Clostridium butyricum]MDU6543336.1 protein-export chaperone SecB [Clostridium sp.]
MSNCKSKLSFKDYIVNKIEFNNNIKCDNKEITMDFDFDSKVEFGEDDKFILYLSVELFKDAEKNNYPFNFKADLIGFFELNEVEESKKQVYAEQNAVAILFPYLRALITTYTGMANVQPLILPPINVAKYIENKKKK